MGLSCPAPFEAKSQRVVRKEPSMPSDWATRRIGDIGRVVTGKTPSTKDPGNFGGPYPFVTIPDLDGRVVIDKTERTLSKQGAEAIKSSLLPQGAVLMSCIATVGKCGITAKPSFTNQQINSVIPDDEIDPDYLYYVFTQLGHEMESAGGGGSVYTNVSKSRFANIQILFPPLPEQRAIAHILGTLDDKIELNRRMNETLEEMARALFKSWFVDFDPVRAKMEGRWRRGESLPGLPAEHYDLFPGRLVPSELGEIPEGWEVRALGDCFNLTMGQSPPGKTYNANGEGLPFFQGNADFGFRYPERRKYCTAPTRIARPGDTLVSVRAPVGAINMAWEECCIGRGVSALRHPSGSSSFTYYAVRALQHKLAEYEHTGTVFGAINKRQFEKLMVIEAPKGFIDHFESYSQKWDERIRSNTKESFDLAAQRDALLPNLVSGVLRVRSQCINRQGST